MRWWLTLAFAIIAAVTAVAVSQLFKHQTQSALRTRAAELTVGSSVAAADEITRTLGTRELARVVRENAKRRGLALYVFSPTGELLATAGSPKGGLAALPEHFSALRAAQRGSRFIYTVEEGRATVVSLPLPVSGPSPPGTHAVLLAFASRPGLAAEFGIVKGEIVSAALWATAIGALVGLLIATLITVRLRRIAAAAAAIASGSFETELRPRFLDELGALALTIDRMRRELRDSFVRLGLERDRLHRVLERLHEGVVTVNRSLEVDYANAAARRFLELPALGEGDPLPEPWPDLSLSRIAAGLFSRDAHVVQARAAADDEHVYTVVGLPAAQAQTAVLVITDVSERERRERAEREFVTNAAHELRTPATAILGAVEVLQAGAKDAPEERDRFITHIEREATRLARLTRALLVLARAQTGAEAPRLAPVSLRPLLEQVASDLLPEQGVAVELICDDGIEVIAERDLLEQVLWNLATNAVKHTRSGAVTVAGRAQGGEVAIEVQDTGPGIPPREQERIFDRFYRTGDRSADGFGLGLSIVRQAVRALGGTIELRSLPGEGSTFSVRLPAARPERLPT